MSLLSVANQGGGTTVRVCDICRSEFRLPTQNLVLVRPPGVPVEWILDIGGYCTNCGGYRCGRHMGARQGYDEEPGAPALPITELFCERCGQRVGPEP